MKKLVKQLGKEYREWVEAGYPEFHEEDAPLKPLLEWLNEIEGISTVFCCSGHDTNMQWYVRLVVDEYTIGSNVLNIFHQEVVKNLPRSVAKKFKLIRKQGVLDMRAPYLVYTDLELFTDNRKDIKVLQSTIDKFINLSVGQFTHLVRKKFAV